ncbi:MAG: response regulator [bacterium]|nr:response regulator [bacterium]
MENVTKILVVDDDADTRSLYADAFRTVNFSVREGKDGLDGLKLVSEDIPDVIVTGIIMPRMDGFGLVGALQKNVATAHIPVVFLSHLGREVDEKHAKKLGVKAFLLRDMTSPRDMIERVNDILTSKEYVLAINPFDFDAAKFAQDFKLNPDFVCPEEKAGGRVVLKLRKQDGNAKSFDAELTCVE